MTQKVCEGCTHNMRCTTPGIMVPFCANAKSQNFTKRTESIRECGDRESRKEER